MVLLKSDIMPKGRVAIGPVVVDRAKCTRGRIETARSLVIQRVIAYAGIPGAGGEARQNPNAVSFIAKWQRTFDIVACAFGESPKQASASPNAMKSDGIVVLNLVGIFI